MDQSSPSFVTSTTHGGVRVVAINRPEKRNALSQAVINNLLEALKQASHEDEVKVVIVTGTSSLFCAGADIKEIAALDSEQAGKSRYLEDLCNGFRAVQKPILAAVEGIALGGGFEMALMCDLIFASKIATFGLPEVRIGLIPGAGGTQRLTNAIGKFRAMKMILSGTPISAPDAHSWGLVSDLCEPGTVFENTLKFARQLAGLSSFAMALAKRAINRADDLGRDDEFERTLYYSAFSSRVKIEGVAAFLEKRKPNWQT